MKTKRLFVFAAYDADSIIDETLVHYVRSLAEIGDVIFTMDNDVSGEDLEKISTLPNVIYANASRHGEYDFGSYKRGYKYAWDNNLLSQYDWVYLVNDSVYGPLWDLEPVLTDLESRGTEFTGMIDFENEATSVQVQSWFVGMGCKLATKPFVKQFLDSVVHQPAKELVVLKYEVGLSRTILAHGYQMATIISGQRGDICHSVYKKPFDVLKSGVPFIKKMGLENMGGLQYLYAYAPEELVNSIYQNATRTGIPMVFSKYRNCFRFTVFGSPIVRITCQQICNCLTVAYKVYLFDKIPVFKISITGLHNDK